MNPPNSSATPKPTNIPYHPNDYWDLARVDQTPVHSLTALPGHMPTTRVSPSPSQSSRGNYMAQLTPPLGQQDMSRGRGTGETYAQKLNLRSRSPRFVPFEWGRGTSSGSGSGAGPDLESGSGSEPDNTPVGAGGGDGGSNGGGSTSAATSEPQTGESRGQKRGQEQDCDDEIVMSSTAYPGQEWRPATLGQRGYF